MSLSCRRYFLTPAKQPIELPRTLITVTKQNGRKKCPKGNRGLTLVTEEGTRDVQLLAADDNDTLTGEGLLGNNGGKATQKVALTVDDNHLS